MAFKVSDFWIHDDLQVGIWNFLVTLFLSTVHNESSNNEKCCLEWALLVRNRYWGVGVDRMDFTLLLDLLQISSVNGIWEKTEEMKLNACQEYLRHSFWYSLYLWYSFVKFRRKKADKIFFKNGKKNDKKSWDMKWKSSGQRMSLFSYSPICFLYWSYY